MHKWVALPLFAFLFLVGVTGVLLGWKKQTGIAPPTLKGSSPNPANWISFDSLQKIALERIAKLQLDSQIDRIDIRPEKGIAKVVFTNHYTELQLDCTTGKILSTETRAHDFIEHLHDGTIVDRLLGIQNEMAKTTYTTITSLGLMLLALSGFLMWRNPRKIRKLKANN